MSTRLALAMLPLWFLLIAEPATAQMDPSCPAVREPPPDAPIVSPPSGEVANVALNTQIRVDLDASLEPRFGLWEFVGSEPNEDVDIPVEATWQRIGDSDRFVIRPSEHLKAQTRYRLVIKGLQGVNRDDFVFKTSDVIDSEPPVFPFGPDRVIEYSVHPCSGDESRYRVSFTIDDATDDGSPGGIEYLLYLTRAEGLDGPLLLKRQYRGGATVTSLSFSLSEEQVAAPVCVSIDAVDTAGNHAEDVKEFCFDPLQGSYFEACSVLSGRAARHGLASAAFMGLAVVALRVRRRRLAVLRSASQR